jgi:hypothetical protein
MSKRRLDRVRRLRLPNCWDGNAVLAWIFLATYGDRK